MTKKKKTVVPYFVTGSPTTEHILYPWVNMNLSGNSRTAHRYKTAEREQARDSGFWITKDAGLELPQGVPIEMDMVICPPDKKWRDDDNILTAFKSIRDGIFLALEINDKYVRKTTLTWGKIVERGGIYVRFCALTEKEYEIEE